MIPFLATAYTGPEFPSIVASIIGFVFVLVTIRTFQLGPPPLLPVARNALPGSLLPFAKSFSPYIVLLALLALGKFLFRPFSYHVEIGEKLSHNIHLFNPGFAFFSALVVLALWNNMRLKTLTEIVKTSLAVSFRTGVTIFFISSVVYILIVSGSLEQTARQLLTDDLPYYAAFMGAFGSFLAGSATVSNLLFAPLQYAASEDLGISTTLILSLQLVGAAAGNMIALPNILAVQASVQLEGRESLFIARLIGPCLIYLTLATVSALLFI